MRPVAIKLVLVLGLALRLHHHFHGPPFDYVGLAVAAGISWAGVPGPGEPVLIAAGVLAARHRLDIGSVMLVAWLGAMCGGIVGWLAGMRAGRAVLAKPGPLLHFRQRALARGDDVFERHAVLAIVLAPTWIAGIHRVRRRIYLPVNAAASGAWAVGIGLAAFLVGPAVIDVVDDLGWVLVTAFAGLVAAGVGAEVLRRRRSRPLA